MARLEAVSKLGYYPLPQRVARMIGAKIEAEPGCSIFDPCAGEGHAVHAIAETADIEKVYGCEIETNRSASFKANYPDSVLYPSTDYIGSIAIGQASVGYVNPPFATQLSGERTEAQFITSVIRNVDPGGLVIVVAPEDVITIKLRGVIGSQLHSVTAFQFPDVDRKFRELALFGYVRTKPDGFAISGFLREYSEVPMYKAIAKKTYPVVKKTEYTEEEVLTEVSKSPMLEHLQTESVRRKKFRPPLTLRKGHLAMMLASGMMDGYVSAGVRSHVVRGSVRKVKDTIEQVDKKQMTITETERIVLTVRTVNNAGDIRTISDSLKSNESEVEDA